METSKKAFVRKVTSYICEEKERKQIKLKIKGNNSGKMSICCGGLKRQVQINKKSLIEQQFVIYLLGEEFYIKG